MYHEVDYIDKSGNFLEIEEEQEHNNPQKNKRKPSKFFHKRVKDTNTSNPNTKNDTDENEPSDLNHEWINHTCKRFMISNQIQYNNYYIYGIVIFLTY